VIRKVIKKLFANKFIRWLLGVIGSYLLIAGIEALRTKINLGKSLINLPAKIINLLINIDIPLYILLLLFFLIWLILLKRKFFVKLRRLKISKREKFILLVIANDRERFLRREDALAMYQQKYKERLVIPFNLDVKDLERKELINQSEGLEGTEYIEITDKGLALISKIYKRIEKKNKKIYKRIEKKNKKKKKIKNSMKHTNKL